MPRERDRVHAMVAQGIDGMLDRLLPAMRARGSRMPICDHVVPDEVPNAKCQHRRKRCVELGEG
jgi:hypothetical protein